MKTEVINDITWTSSNSRYWNGTTAYGSILLTTNGQKYGPSVKGVKTADRPKYEVTAEA